ncbi:hypothetical protein KDN24_06390 [Bacillus sp. Bva_UNVM-123]|uniref:hypothetical protein n=1 Tax=Bacillus sp. Bva_UNVM-123 TaxID=2829798 RepID=UPI00391EEDF3
MYMLERSESYVVPTEITKNRTCQTVRWKQVAISDSIEALKEIKQPHMRIIDWNTLKVIIDAELFFK